MVIKRAVREGIGDNHAARHHDGANFFEELLRQHVLRNVIGVERVQQHHVVIGLLRRDALHVNTPVLNEYMRVRTRLKIEIASRHAIDRLVQLDKIDLRIGEHLLKGRWYGAATLADDQYAFGIGIEVQPAQHHLGVIEDQLFGLVQQLAGLAPQRTGPTKQHAALVAILRHKDIAIQRAFLMQQLLCIGRHRGDNDADERSQNYQDSRHGIMLSCNSPKLPTRPQQTISRSQPSGWCSLRTAAPDRRRSAKYRGCYRSSR